VIEEFAGKSLSTESLESRLDGSKVVVTEGFADFLKVGEGEGKSVSEGPKRQRREREKRTMVVNPRVSASIRRSNTCLCMDLFARG
jgi:hypothetical protein